MASTQSKWWDAVALSWLIFALALMPGPTSRAAEVNGQEAEKADAQSAEPEVPEPFATVNGYEISLERYVQALQGTARGTFYHGRPPDGDFEKFRYEVGQSLIEATILAQEAERRGIPADAAWVDTRLAKLDERYGERPEWQERAEEIKFQLRDHLTAQSRVSRLEEQIREIPAPSEEQLRAYYEQNKALFTSPEQLRVHMILLHVDPSAARATWEAAAEEARRIDEKLRSGADFAELARIHSQDPSAEEGGDLGYIHRGMLGSFPQTALDELEPGQLSGPVQLLEGIALFRLAERIPGELNEFEAVRERATELWLRESRDRAREELLADLRTKARIEVLDPEYLKLAASQSAKAAEGEPRREEGEADEDAE